MSTSSLRAEIPLRSPDALGRAIRRRRSELGWTQADLAARALSNRFLIGDLEAGHETRAIRAVFDALSALDLELVVRARRVG
ncbi:MAG: helix-turn-helix domain-containing protein [Acidimicrobiales bacterium]